MRRDRNDAGDGQCQAKIEKADAERRGQQWKQRRQHQVLEVVYEMRRRHQRECLVFPGLPALAAGHRQRLGRHPGHCLLFRQSCNMACLTRAGKRRFGKADPDETGNMMNCAVLGQRREP
jgi:hypothetical protein